MPDGDGFRPDPLAVVDRTTTDRVFAALSDLILSGALPPGAKLSEPDLAARFGTSRAPLREALRRLEARKLVTHVARHGVRVTTLDPGRITEIYQVREVLEGLAAAQAARRMTDADISELRALLDQHAARVSAGDPYFQGTEDDDFHFRIIRASGNHMLTALLLDEYYLLIRLLRRQIRHPAGVAERALVEHRRVLDAIADRAPDLAETMMRRHIAAAHGRLCAGLPDPSPTHARPRKETDA